MRLVLPDDLYSWPDGAEAPGPAILCKSLSNPKHYEVFKRAVDVREAEFDRTGTAYGGLYSELHWGRFVQDFPRISKFLRIPVADPTDAFEGVLPTMKRVH